MKSYFQLILLPVILFRAYIVSAQSFTSESTFVPFASGLSSPVCIAHAGDSRLFVVSQHGSVTIVDSAGNVDPEPFLNISGRIVYGGEQGLLGIAFHPNFKSNGYFYVNYTGTGDSTHISRFSTRAENPDKADTLSELKLLTLAQPFKNHNGGNLSFGPDGYLYIGLGDGGSGGDPGNRAQNKKEWLGKMLRIDVDQGNTYSIPADNPFVQDTSVRPEIWALGLRNPWKYSFDRLTGDLWIADVGQDQIEEIDFQPAGSTGGENYGWRCFEGDQPFNSERCAPDSSFTSPVYTYNHGDDCSVTGGYVYRGNPTSPYYGYYFFTDYCSDKVWTLHKQSDKWIREDAGQFKGNNFSAFGEDYRGQLYVAGVTSGVIYQLNSPVTGLDPAEKAPFIRVIQYPADNRIRLETDRKPGTRIMISIYDIRGIKHFEAITADSNYEFDLNSLATGIYILSVMSDGEKLVQKIRVGR